MSNKSSTGTGSLAGDLLVHSILVAVGVALALWVSSMTGDERQHLLHMSVNALALILAQPGIFLSFKIATNDKSLPNKRVPMAILVFVVFAWAIPTAISSWVFSVLPPA